MEVSNSTASTSTLGTIQSLTRRSEKSSAFWKILISLACNFSLLSTLSSMRFSKSTLPKLFMLCSSLTFSPSSRNSPKAMAVVNFDSGKSTK